jgi:hypothetical protein
MRFTRRSTFVGIIAAIFGDSKVRASPVRVNTEEGFADLDLPLAAAPQATRVGQRLLAQGTYDGHRVGFAAEIYGEWIEKPLDDKSATFYWGKVTLRSIGEPSDNFVEALSKLYGVSSKSAPMLSEITAQAVGLADDPRTLLEGPVRMKLFFHSDIEERYAEVFMNLDVPSRVVQFHEKDQEYRQNVVRALRERA